jgi:phage regulator Rha-like protein
MVVGSTRTVDSRAIAQAFGQRHHNVLNAVDLVLRQCPTAAVHFRFQQRPVTAGLGGTRYVRHVFVDREGFMLLAMSFPSKQRELALEWLWRLSAKYEGTD